VGAFQPPEGVVTFTTGTHYVTVTTDDPHRSPVKRKYRRVDGRLVLVPMARGKRRVRDVATLAPFTDLIKLPLARPEGGRPPRGVGQMVGRWMAAQAGAGVRPAEAAEKLSHMMVDAADRTGVKPWMWARSAAPTTGGARPTRGPTMRQIGLRRRNRRQRPSGVR
jgi:hypothetical protein